MAYEDRSYSGAAIKTALSANITATATSIPITASTGWPDGTSGPFHVAIYSSTDPTTIVEVIRCSGRSGNTLNVQTTPVSGRGWDGTTAASHLTGTTINHVFTATDADESNQHIANTGLDHHSQYLTVARHDLTTRHGASVLPIGGTPSSSVVGDTAQSGTSSLIPRSDHRHAREGFGTPVRTGNAIAAGTATTLARSDHVHTDSPVICTSSTRPTGSNLWNGLTIIETDTRKIRYYDAPTAIWYQIGWTGTSGRTGATLTRTAYDIASGGANPTLIPWSGETFDSDNFISPDGTTTTSFMIPSSALVGIYLVSVVGTWSSLFTERSFVEIIHAGAGETRYRFVTTGEDRWAATCMLTMDPGDPSLIQVGVFQLSGATKQVTATAEIYRVGL